MGATSLDESSVLGSVRTTNVSVTSSERPGTMVRLGEEDGNVAFTDIDDEAVLGGMVVMIDNILPAECDVDNDVDEDTEVGGFECKEDD